MTAKAAAIAAPVAAGLGILVARIGIEFGPLPRGRPARDCRPWSHLLDRLDADHGEAAGDDDCDAAYESEPSRVSIGSEVENKPQRRLVATLVPQHVELGRNLLQIEGDTVRLVRLGGAFDQPRPQRQLANSAPSSAEVGEPVERGFGQRRDRTRSSAANASIAWRITEAARAWAYCT